ncbi:3-phosphoserine/phosphohydroxythreonine transaminase [Limnobacter parvus]|uniref:Phosphoserine aminotransferase n=1 Tax=Limnobacter parvus TaxID=2939690 RepID=A0ABT1XK97_9BURK|nr:3-phosphoserine/phosphohydroxythreonine transaminase [Limnobacter parvus]MCR2747720.1 3-phosphoserine/phosphohydroxythreonine transaminase [Limnobacter parvus]
MSRVWNFSAGPAALPESVLRRAAEEMLDWQGKGLSVMEMSHRSPEYTDIFEKTRSDFRKLLNVPETHDVLFMQGGAVGMNAIVPMNLMNGFEQAAFVNTGAWSKKTAKEFSKYGLSRVVLDNANSVADSAVSCYVPECAPLLDRVNGQQMAYLHYCDNETISGVEFNGQVEAIASQLDCPVVADMSSNILSKTLEVSKYGVIYGGAQKNVGPAGVTIVIVDKALLNRALPICPSAFTFGTVAENGSMYNTPPTYSIYIAGLVFEWLIEQGGVQWAQSQAQEKASLLYGTIDSSTLYNCPVRTEDRSRMNVPFTLADESLNARFLSRAAEQGLVQLKGHKSVGGMRASIYNAMPLEGVKALVEFMCEFEKSET